MNWVIWDNFYLEYLGQCVMDYAVALPETGAMEADTWYYFDVAIAADNYLATATTLNDIICTTDGYTLTSATAGDVTLSAENNSLSAIRYYVKSSLANNLVISVASYSYTINEATISADYVQPGNTVTVNFSTITNDPNPVLTQDYSGVTFNGSAIDVTPTESGFTFTVPEVSEASTYTLSIPAGAIKYNDDNKNAAQDLTLNTPAVFDGTYYLYNPFTEKFLGRGANYGTAAVVDKYGIPFKLATGSDGYSTIQFVDNDGYLFNSYWLFADGATGDNFRIAAQTIGSYTGYAFYNKNAELGTNNRMYAYVNDNGDNYRVAGNAIIGDNCTNEAQTVWQIKTVEEHNAIVNAYPVQNIQNVITNAGISTTTNDFSTFLSENYRETDKTSLIGTATFSSDAGDWTWNEVRGENEWPKYTNGIARLYQATGTYTQTIASENLPAGIYKVTMGGFDRRATEAIDKTLATTYGSVSSSYLKANDEQVRIMSWVESYTNNGSEPTTTWETQAACVNEGKAKNELYVYLDGSTILELTVAKTNFCGESYMVFSHFTLTYYEPTLTISENTDYTPESVAGTVTVTLNRTLTADTWNSFVVPFQISNEELKATFGDDVAVAEYSETAEGTNSTIYFNTMETPAIAANTPVLLKPSTVSATGEYVFEGRTVATGDAKVAGTNFDFVGTYAASGTIAAGDYFISGDKLYKSAGTTTIKGTRAYLKAKSAEAKARLVFDNGTATSIEAIEMDADKLTDGNVYDLSGRLMKTPVKGLYIKNGKKILVK
ncbi:MAG: hypothetical protein IJV06_02180 [Bacteroidaceae bacterium]|nr:hypothetical protein [Bacteroidaceae bacterium]